TTVGLFAASAARCRGIWAKQSGRSIAHGIGRSDGSFRGTLTGNDILYACRQRLHREGLDHYLHASLKEAVAHDGILGIAGDKQDFQTRAMHPRNIGNLPAIHAAW